MNSQSGRSSEGTMTSCWSSWRRRVRTSFPPHYLTLTKTNIPANRDGSRCIPREVRRVREYSSLDSHEGCAVVPAVLVLARAHVLVATRLIPILRRVAPLLSPGTPGEREHRDVADGVQGGSDPAERYHCSRSKVGLECAAEARRAFGSKPSVVYSTGTGRGGKERLMNSEGTTRIYKKRLRGGRMSLTILTQSSSWRRPLKLCNTM